MQECLRNPEAKGGVILAEAGKRMLDLKKNLNDQQLQAVEVFEGPLLILAGAGSGKTRVITYRIAHLAQNRKVRPENILAVTFTNKAADTMKQRVEALLQGERSGNPLISTFHSFCVRVLRRDASLIGYTPDFTIYDDTDQQNVVKSCLKEVGVEEKVLSPRNVLSQISFSKNQGRSPEEVYEKAFAAQSEKVAVLYKLYEKKLKQANALDFDDLLLKTVSLMETQPSVSDRLNRQYRFVMVDEFQDTNRIQYQLIRLLTRDQQNLCVVGDEDQSIYAWRGADIQNILSFERDYPKTQMIKLEQNYRSTQNILDAAGAVVANNFARKGKTLWTEKKGGELITLFEAADADAEARFVAQRIQSHLRSSPRDSVAVLYRTNFQSRLFEEACQRTGLKYHMVGGFSFYERAEIKDMLAYLKLSLNPLDPIALKRVINTPARGIGKTTLDTLEKESRNRGLSLWDTISYALEQRTFTPRTLTPLSEFKELICQCREQVKEHTFPEFLQWLIERSGYLKMLESEDSEEARSRIDNLKELIHAARDSVGRGESIRDFIDHAALVSEADDYDERARVTLMTLHSAKGLEFSTVFLVGMEEGLFPHSRSMSNESQIEEERRLCYVGMTRAEKKLYLTRARFRRFLSSESSGSTEVSRFVSEIPTRLTDLNWEGAPVAKSTVYQGQTYNSLESIQGFYRQRGRQIDLSPLRRKESAGAGPVRYGGRVRHAKFGLGSVVRSEGEGDEAKLTVSFPGHGLKKILRKFVTPE
jgi:DNA helicase-2/ATP-dependent DNA helicase PcrA